jgi:hypothetical protein
VQNDIFQNNDFLLSNDAKAENAYAGVVEGY